MGELITKRNYKIINNFSSYPAYGIVKRKNRNCDHARIKSDLCRSMPFLNRCMMSNDELKHPFFKQVYKAARIKSVATRYQYAKKKNANVMRIGPIFTINYVCAHARIKSAITSINIISENCFVVYRQLVMLAQLVVLQTVPPFWIVAILLP